MGRYNSWQDSSGNTKTRSNRYISQIGGDIAAWTDAENQQALHLGLMAGYAHSRAISHSVVNGQRSIVKTDGYGLGMKLINRVLMSMPGSITAGLRAP